MVLWSQTLAHKKITTYNEFTKRLINRFDDKVSEWYFQELTHLKQIGTMEEYVRKFLELSIMIHDLPQKMAHPNVYGKT